MIKKIEKVLLCVAILLSVSMIGEAKASFTTKLSFGTKGIGKEVKYQSGGTWHDYHQSEMFLTDSSGVKYTAYCVDPNYKANTNDVYTCSQMKNKKAATALAYLLTYFEDNATKSRTVKTLSIRFVAIHYDLFKAGSDDATEEKDELAKLGKWMLLAMRNYVANLDKAIAYEKKGKTATAEKYYNKAAEYMKDSEGVNYLARATALYKKAIEKAENSSSTADSSYTGKLTWAKDSESSSGNTYTATYTVKSTKKIKASEIYFECATTGCQVTKQSWDEENKTGSVTISVTSTSIDNGNCKYKIQARYQKTADTCEAADIMFCSYNDKRHQQLLISECEVDKSNSTGDKSNFAKVSKDNGGSITANIPDGTDYYATYCKNPCEEEEGQTKIDIPTYCDDAEDKYITVSAPTNVKQCILKAEDEAGNTYQSAAVSSDNNYCAVYCAEDYKITLPGAKYTTSGKYFELRNTVVEGTRTCYATSKSGNSNKNIDIEQFVQDVIAKQKEIIAARDAYLKAEAERDASYTSDTDSTCSGGTVTHYTKDSVNYTGVALQGCDSKSGVCSLRNETHSTSSYNWGEYNTISWTKCAAGAKNCTPVCIDDSSSVPEPDWNEMVENANKTLSSLVKELEAMIDDMEECYNWINDFCLDPDVAFDYNETYNTKINYEEVSKTITNNKNVTYSSSKEIDNAYSTNEQATLENVNYLACGANGCSYSAKAEQISTLYTHYYYIKKVSTGNAEYNNKQQFQTNYPHGTIDKVADKNSVKYNYSYLGAVFPVALKRETGVYNWTLAFDKVGQYNDEKSCKLGRINDVAKKQGKTLNDTIGYVCVYVVDCDDCDYGCTCPTDLPNGYSCKENGFTCEIEKEEPKCDDCDVYCVNCIFDGNDTFNYRTISLTDVNPNNRTMGSNWTSEKGKETLTKIETQSEKAYINPEYSYTITPTQMKNIRDYNRQKGTYIADDLSYQAKDGYANIVGISSFLNTGQSKGFFTQNARNSEWTLWTGTINTNGVGPSWK